MVTSIDNSTSPYFPASSSNGGQFKEGHIDLSRLSINIWVQTNNNGSILYAREIPI